MMVSVTGVSCAWHEFSAMPILLLAFWALGTPSASGLLSSGYAQRAVEAARQAAQAEREADEHEEARAAEEARVAEKRRASEAKAKERAAERRAAKAKAKKERAAARRAVESTATKERKTSVDAPPTAVRDVVGVVTAVDKSVGTPPAAVSALLAESFGTDVTGAAANQGTCDSQCDGGMPPPTSGSGARAAAPKAMAETVHDAALGDDGDWALSSFLEDDGRSLKHINHIATSNCGLFFHPLVYRRK